MYCVCDTGLSGNFTFLAGASEMRLTAVSLSKIGSGPEKTKFCACSSRFSPSPSEVTKFSSSGASNSVLSVAGCCNLLGMVSQVASSGFWSASSSSSLAQ